MNDDFAKRSLFQMRILMGLGGGLTFPAMNVLVAEWAPRQERSTMSSLVFGGDFQLTFLLNIKMK